MVCKIVFCSEFPIFRITLAEKQEEEEHKQLQSVVSRKRNNLKFSFVFFYLLNSTSVVFVPIASLYFILVDNGIYRI